MASAGGRKRYQVLATAAAVAIAGSVVIAKISPSVTLYPVAATFRCPGTNCTTTADRIQGDGYDAVYIGSTATQQGAYLDGGYNFYFPLKASASPLRTVYLDFSQVYEDASLMCGSNCRKDFVVVPATPLSLPALVQTVDNTNTLLPNGFYSLAVGQSSPARLKIDFPDPDGRAYMWTIRLNASGGSGLASVTRTATNQWLISADGSTPALLQSTNTTGHQVAQSEGLYYMPFQITVRCGDTSATPCPK